MRILGLDYGDRRIGVALCDELGITARGIATIERKNRKTDMENIRNLVETHGAETIVLGYPLRLDGTPGIQCAKVDRFAELLSSVLAVPVVKWDETLSTKEAEEILSMTKGGRRRKKHLVDQLAAGIILQHYLNAQAARR